MGQYSLSIKGGVMEQGTRTQRWWRTCGYAAGIGLLLSPGLSWGLEVGKTPPAERRETISLADAALQALKHNLDISISRQTKESRQADITVEQAKFDPTLSVNGQYNRTVNPLNRPVFGGTGNTLGQITTFDQRSESVTFDATTNLLTGGNVDLNYSPSRSNVNQNVATGFLFNPAYTGGLALTLTQPLLRNAGLDITKTFIRVAQNNAIVEEHIFRDRVLTVLATVEQTYWEVVFANENLKVAEAALKAAQELLASNRAKAKAGIMSIVDVLQAEAAVASRVEQVLVADKTIRDQEDQLRRLLNPAEEDLRQDLRLTPLDQPTMTLEPISLQEAIATAIEQRPEIVQAKKNMETSDINSKFAKNQILPTVSFEGTMGLAGLGKDYGDSV
jgi:outer membrane protein TolC